MRDETAPDLLEEVASGDRRRALVAIRDALAAQLLEADDPSKAAAVAKVLAGIVSDLTSMAKPEGSKRDELAAARAARRGAPVPDSPAVGDDSGGNRSGRARGKRRSAP